MKQKSILEIGQKIKTNTGEVEVLSIDNQNVKIRFDDGYETVASKDNVKRGNVRNPYFKTYFGVGYRGEGGYKMHGQLTYNKWSNIMVRCYNPQYKVDHPTYDGVYCCDEWHNYQTFCKWAYDQVGFGEKGFDLDKDLLFKGNKVYSPDTCVFIPQELNKILGNTGAGRGISTRSDLNGKWMVRCNTIDGEIYLGCHEKSVALKIYQNFKLNYLEERAEFWKGKIDPRAYEALKSYTFE